MIAALERAAADQGFGAVSLDDEMLGGAVRVDAPEGAWSSGSRRPPAAAACAAVRGLGLDGRGWRLLVLTCATGLVDAVAFLGLGQVFCAMQTGNVVFLGIGIADVQGAPDVAAPLTALCAFVIGGVAAVLLLRAGADARDGRGAATSSGVPAVGVAGVRAAAGAEIGLLVLATAAAAVFAPRAGDAAALLTIALLALAMGLRTTIVRRRGGANLATTVLNLTAIGGAAGDGLAGSVELAQRVAGLVALLLGAIAGALLLEAALWLPLAIATVLTLATHALDRPALATA